MRFWLSKDEIERIFEESLVDFPELNRENILLKTTLTSYAAVIGEELTTKKKIANIGVVFVIPLIFFTVPLITYLWYSLAATIVYVAFFSYLALLAGVPMLGTSLYLLSTEPFNSETVLLFPRFWHYLWLNPVKAMHHELAHIYLKERHPDLWEYFNDWWKDEDITNEITEERMNREEN